MNICREVSQGIKGAAMGDRENYVAVMLYADNLVVTNYPQVMQTMLNILRVYAER